MPKIRPYETQVEYQGREVRSNANLRDPGFGDVIGSVAKSVATIQDADYRRQAQNEVSDLTAKFSESRADWANRIDESIANGSVDTEKIQTEFQDYVNQMNQNISTAEGRDFFDRQSAGLGAYVIRSASKGQAVVAGAKAEAAWKDSINFNSNVLQSDPSGFEDAYQANIDAIDTQVGLGTIPASHAEKFKLETARSLSKAAVVGWAKLNPDLAEKKLTGGEYDSYLDADSKQQLQGYINSQKSAREIEETRKIKAQERLQKVASEKWQNDVLPDLAKGALNTEAILDSPMAPEEKIKWLRLADEAVKDVTQQDPRVKNELTRRILLPESDPQKIRSIADLAPYAGRGVSVTDIEQLNGFIQKLPEGEAANDNRKRLIDFAQAQLIKKDPMLGITDPDGEYSMAQFQISLQQAEAQMRKDNKPVTSLYDPSSPDYFGKLIGKYRATPQQVFAKMAGRMSQQYTDPLQSAPVQATGQPPVQVNPAQSKVRQPGESPQDFLRRMGLAK